MSGSTDYLIGLLKKCQPFIELYIHMGFGNQNTKAKLLLEEIRALK